MLRIAMRVMGGMAAVFPLLMIPGILLHKTWLVVAGGSMPLVAMMGVAPSEAPPPPEEPV
jgi:hypothetical protein